MKLACSSWSLHREIPANLPLTSFPAWCGSNGIPAIELTDTQLPSTEPAYLDELRRACDHAGVEIACLTTSNDFTIPDSDQLFTQVEQMRKLLYDVALPLRVPVVRVFIGMADTSDDGEARAGETFREMVTDLEATGISMALENHGRTMTPPDQTAAIIAGVGSPLFGSCLDFSSLPPERRYVALMALAPLAKHAHAVSYDFDTFGMETSIDYRRALAILTEHRYDGTLSIVYEGQGDPYQGILTTKALIERIWYHPEMGEERKAA